MMRASDERQAATDRQRLPMQWTEQSEHSQRLVIDGLVRMLSSPDGRLRQQGYALFREGLEDALFQSCLNYGALAGDFTHPLLWILEEAIERWAIAASTEPAQPPHRPSS